MNSPWRKKSPKPGLVVKDLLPELEQAVDVKKRIREVRTEPHPDSAYQTQTDWVLRAGTAVSPFMFYSNSVRQITRQPKEAHDVHETDRASRDGES